MLSIWQMWLIGGIILLVIELINAGFGIICFGIGCFFAALMAACGLGMAWQLAAFTVASFLSFLFIRPIIMKWLDTKNGDKMNLDGMIGRMATVIEVQDHNNCRVAIDGTDWKAVATTPVTKGETVCITQRTGNTLTVEARPEAEPSDPQ